MSRPLAISLQTGIASLALPCLAFAQSVTVHGGRVPAPSAGEGFAMEVVARTGSPSASLRFLPSDGKTVRLRSQAGCEVVFEDQDRDGHHETRRIRDNGRLVGKCTPLRSSYSRSAVDAGTGAGKMENCRVETTTRRDVLCQPTVNGRAEGDPWVIARNIGADSLSWDHGLLILDDEFGTVYRIQETGDDAARALDLSSLIESGSSDRIRLSMHSHIGKDNSPLTAERQAIIDKQKEAFPRAFEESDAETPQAARAFNGAAARAARRNRKRPKSEK